MNIDEIVAKLQRHLTALGNPRDVPSTENAQAAFWGCYNTTQQTITGLRNIENDLAKPERLLADAEERRAVVLEKTASIEQQIADAPDWRSAVDGRSRDREYDRQQQLKQQLQLAHEGRLLIGPGICLERLSDLDDRIDELRQKIASLRARHASHLRQAEALLGEAVTQ